MASILPRFHALVLLAVLASAPTALAQQTSAFVPVTPCRIADTRLGDNPGPIAGGTIRKFDVVGAGYDAQGGTSGSCGIPTFMLNGLPSVTAVAMNVVAVSPAAQGNLIVYPTDAGSVPTASTVNFPAPSVPLNVANGVIVPVRQDSAGNDVSVKPSQTTHVVIDVTGYFVPLPMRTFYSAAATIPNVFSDGNTGAIGEAAPGTRGMMIFGGNANFGNLASFGTVIGGASNTVQGNFAIVAGGRSNVASGVNSFAAGRRAVAADDGSFVWADDNDFDFTSTQANNFRVRATGGVRFVTAIDGSGNGTSSCTINTSGDLNCTGTIGNASDRNAKTDVAAIDTHRVLEEVAALPIASWRYKNDGRHARHLGPMAQDFKTTFGLGGDDRQIATVDEEGVALAAIQELYRLVREDRAEMRRKDAEIARLRARLGSLESVAERAPDERRVASR